MKVKVDYGTLPDEMKLLNQWCCFDLEPEEGKKDKKVPYTPGSTSKARSNEVSTLRSYEEALEDVVSGVRDHLGFCIIKEDPYVFFDLDEPQNEEQKVELNEVIETFNSFSEVSISGTGVHIIAKGQLDGRGLHNEYFGLFDANRFILVTGHIYKGRDEIYLANTDKLAQLQDRVRTSSGRGFNFPLDEKEWDMEPWAIYNTTMSVYKQKYINLMGGAWREYGYPSQSEADHALISMMCEFTESNELVRYMFADSGLFRDWKGGGYPQTYIDRTIQLQRDKVMNEQIRREDAKLIALANLKDEREREAKVKAKVTKKKTVAKKVTKKSKSVEVEPVDHASVSDDAVVGDDELSGFDYPTTLIDRVPSKMHRWLALWLYKNSYIPNQQFCIATANVIIVSFTQRAYMTPTNTGCNLNIWLVAATGMGKDIFTKGLDMVISALATDLPHFGATHVGKFASGEGVETVIGAQPRFMSKVAEAGAFWRKLLAPNKAPHIDALSEVMLNLFMSTDKDRFYRSRRKAKKDEDVKDTIFRAAGSFYGESTFTDFFGDLDLASVGTGLLQRQIIVGVDSGEYVKENHYREEMPAKLKSLLIEAIGVADNLDITNDHVKVKISRRADSIIKEYSEKNRRYNYKADRNLLRSEYMNRTVIKIYRYASQLAIGNDPHDPVIREDQMEYALKWVSDCDEYMLSKFLSGDVGKGQLKQEADIMRIVKSIANATPRKREKSYKFKELVALDNSLLTYSKLRGDAKLRSSFQTDKLGAITAIDRCIDSLCKAGVLSRLSKQESMDEYETSATLLRYNGIG
tara:strand:- start:5718 stop:8132 length:2415 start_codon:yes stop_codon:yes gene_type:complete